MMKGIVVILGALNDDEGNLSDMAIGRLTKGIEEYKNNKNYKILCTGGFGEHFNRTDKPHAFYAKKYLLRQGILRGNLLEIAESHDTVRDAFLAKPIIDKYKVKNLIIVSSDFHMKRVRYIFERVFEGYNLIFSEAKTNFSEERYKVLYAHEEKEFDKLMKEGFISSLQ